MRQRRTINVLGLCLFCLLRIVPVGAQPQVQLDTTIVDHNLNLISNAFHLDDVFEKLYRLRTAEGGTVNIIHVGDSHIQADFLTEVVRKKLQVEFGNAGRGLVVPARLAGTNEPLNFRSSSPSQWTSKRLIHIQKPLPIGIGGITLNTIEETALFSIKMNDTAFDYSFNTVGLFFKKDAKSFNISVLDSAASEIGMISAAGGTPSTDFTRVTLPANYTQIQFKMKKERAEQVRATLFGLNLENGQKGVFYHAIGVNGAKYEHYNAAELFAAQTSLLMPDLFIISLGTNESVEYPYVKTNLLNQIDRLIQNLSRENPQARFILVTPPDAFLRKVKPNPGIETVRSQIIQYAVENGYGFWDMYKINGGKNSASVWKMKGLLRPDGIHFSKDGYAYQGQLLFEAIMKSYNNYVSTRHP
jgi:lysophospholipase L1-like esterase